MCNLCDTQLRPEALDAFGNQFLTILNHAAVAQMISVGHRVGLFSTMHRTGAVSSGELADAANLHERYVREWLGAMAAGGIVEVDPTGTIYTLPPVHAAMLAPEGDGECLAHLAQYISMFGLNEERLIKCFQQGGGVPYEAFPRFHQMMAEDSGQTVVEPLFEHLLPLDPQIGDQLEAGIEVLDVGCGRGRALLAMAERFPHSRFTGLDLSGAAIDWARARARERGLGNIRFQQQDLTSFDLDAPSEAFDMITAFDAIHDQARPDRVLAGIRRALRPGGLFFMQDIGASSNVAENLDHPLGPLLYYLSCSHCMTVSLAQGGLGVGAMWGEELTCQFLNEAGFQRIARHQLDHDPQNYYYTMRV